MLFNPMDWKVLGDASIKKNVSAETSAFISHPDLIQGQSTKGISGNQLRHIKWGLISKLSMSLFSKHPTKSLRSFFSHFESLNRYSQCSNNSTGTFIKIWPSIVTGLPYSIRYFCYFLVKISAVLLLDTVLFNHF